MIEVFKTNISERFYADMMVEQIQRNFKGYKANFDLEDCDKILRVKSSDGFIPTAPLIKLLNDFGFYAEPLPDDDIPVPGWARCLFAWKINKLQNHPTKSASTGPNYR